MKFLVIIANFLAKTVGFIRVPYFLLKDLLGTPIPRPLSLPESMERELWQRIVMYAELAKEHQDADGFILTEKSDALLFSALIGCVPHLHVNLEAARDASGAWFRRPVGKYPPSYPDLSKSTISRDMLLGVLWYAWRNHRLDLAEALWAYGSSHDWVMGEGDWGAIYFSPSMQATLAELIYRLGGKNRRTYRAIPQVYSRNTGFRAHLDVMHILLRQEMTNRPEAVDILEWQYLRQRNNPLFTMAYRMTVNGDRIATALWLLTSEHFPDDRLPTDAEHSEPYLWQRDFGSDWEPEKSPRGVVYPGADWLWLAYTLLL